MKKGNRIAFQALFGLYIIGILFLCFGHFENTPSVAQSIFGIPTDKLVHFTMFAPFPFLAFLAFDQFTETKKATFLFTGVTFIVGLLIAFGTEWGQAHLTDYRSGDPYDLLADTLALLLSSVAIAVIDICKQKKRVAAFQN